jgi:hypothetical protein
MALNMLRSAMLEPEVEPHFDERLIRRVKVQRVKESLGYWSPALAGAVIAGMTIFAALGLVTRSGQAPQPELNGGQAKRLVEPAREFPSLELRENTRFLR